LYYCSEIQESLTKGHVAIDSNLIPELLTELRIATADEEMSLDKNRVLDGLATYLACQELSTIKTSIKLYIPKDLMRISYI
jgi:hypothetical protein